MGQIVCAQVRGFDEKEVKADANDVVPYYITKSAYDANSTLVSL